MPAPLRWRLVYQTGHGRRSLIVDCHRTGEGFTIRLPEFNMAADYLTDAPVALTLISGDGFDANAVITGRSHPVDDQAVDLDAISALERRPEGVRARYFLITPTHGRPYALDHVRQPTGSRGVIDQHPSPPFSPRLGRSRPVFDQMAMSVMLGTDVHGRPVRSRR